MKKKSQEAVINETNYGAIKTLMHQIYHTSRAPVVMKAMSINTTMAKHIRENDSFDSYTTSYEGWKKAEADKVYAKRHKDTQEEAEIASYEAQAQKPVVTEDMFVSPEAELEQFEAPKQPEEDTAPVLNMPATNLYDRLEQAIDILTDLNSKMDYLMKMADTEKEIANMLIARGVTLDLDDETQASVLSRLKSLWSL